MTSFIRKYVSLLLVACMLLGSMSMTAFAEGSQENHIRSELRSSDAFSVGKSGDYVIAAMVNGVYYAMSNSFSSKITGTAIAVMNGCVSESDAAGFIVSLTYSGGSYTIQNSTHYLKYSSSTNLGAVTTAYNWTITPGSNGSWRITASSDAGRGLVFRAKTYNQFGGYALSNVKEGSAEYFDVEILPVKEGTSGGCSHSNTETSTTEASCLSDGVKTVRCKDCGTVLSTTTIPATGHSYQYASNGNGTHKITCKHCTYSANENCTLSGGKCSRCGWVNGSADTGDFKLITSADQITDGNYVLMVAPGGTNPGNYPYYAITRQMHGTSYIMAEGLQLNAVPQTMTVSNPLMIWNLSGNSTAFTLTGEDGSVLYNSSNNLYYGDGVATSWTATFSDGTFILNADTRYLGLRDDITTVDSNGNPCFRCNSSAKTSSYQFYLFKSGDVTDATCEHNASYVEGTPAGCKTEGTIPHYLCTLCNRLFKDTLCKTELSPADIIVPPLGHDLKAMGGIEATCGSDGMMAHYHCNTCDAYFLDKNATQEVSLTELTIPALGHDLVETPAAPATCGRDGNITYYTCEICNAIFSDKACQNQIHLIDTIIPSLNHPLTYSPVVEATCVQSGVYAYYYCGVCDVYYSDEDCSETIAKEDLNYGPLGHDIQFTNRIEPACTENGYLAHYYCNRCLLLFSDAQGKNSLTEQDVLIPPTGHNYNKVVTAPTCTLTGMEEYTCTACGDYYSVSIPAAGHNYVNGSCINCGENSGTVDSSIVINHTLDLASDISINFAVRASLLAAYDSYYMECRIPVYEGNTFVGYNTVEVQPVATGSYYYFTLRGITAVQMGDTVQAVVHMTKGNEYYISATDTYSVASYAYAQLNRTTTVAKLSSLCANLLQYGAAAQIYKNYRTNTLVDASMTDAHRAFLTDMESVVFTKYNTTHNDLTNPKITWAGKSLALDSKITVKYIVNVSGYTGNIEDLSLRVQYKDYKGQDKTVTIETIEKYGSNDGWYCFNFDSLLAAEMRQVLSAAVYQGNTRVSQTLEYSPQSYGLNKSGTLLAVCKAMIAYSDSAFAYFAN